MKLLLSIKIFFILTIISSISFASPDDKTNKAQDCVTALRSSDAKTIINKDCYKLESEIIDHLAKDTNFDREALLKLLDIQKSFFEEKKYHNTVVMGKTIIGLIKRNPELQDIEQRSNFTNAFAYGFLQRPDKANEILVNLLNKNHADLKQVSGNSVAPDREEILGRLIMLYVSMNYWDMAIDHTNKMLDLQNAKYGTDSKKVKDTIKKIELFKKQKIEDKKYNKATEEIGFFIEKKDYSSAIQICKNLIEDLKTLGATDSTINSTYLNLARIYLIAKKYKNAEDVLLNLIESVSDSDVSPKKESILKSIIELYSKANNSEQVLKYYKISADYLKTKYGIDNPEYIKVKKNLDKINELSENNILQTYINPINAIQIFETYCVANIQKLERVNFEKQYENIRSVSPSLSNNGFKEFALKQDKSNLTFAILLNSSQQRCDVRGTTDNNSKIDELMKEKFGELNKKQKRNEDDIVSFYKKDEINYMLRLKSTRYLGYDDKEKRLFTLTAIQFH